MAVLFMVFTVSRVRVWFSCRVALVKTISIRLIRSVIVDRER